MGNSIQPKKTVDRETSRTRGLNLKVPRPKKKKSTVVESIPIVNEKDPPKTNRFKNSQGVKHDQNKQSTSREQQASRNIHKNSKPIQKEKRLKEETSEKVITITEDQLSKLLAGIVQPNNSNSNVNVSNEIKSTDKSDAELEAVDALAILQNSKDVQPKVEAETTVEKKPKIMTKNLWFSLIEGIFFITNRLAGLTVVSH